MASNVTKILLVEDDPNFGDVLRSYLEMNDYDVTLATDGAAGWEAGLQPERITVAAIKQPAIANRSAIRNPRSEIVMVFPASPSSAGRKRPPCLRPRA